MQPYSVRSYTYIHVQHNIWYGYVLYFYNCQVFILLQMRTTYYKQYILEVYSYVLIMKLQLVCTWCYCYHAGY